MASSRNTEDLLLDAARELVMAVGVRRTTAADVARRAGVSRMTLYRSFPDASALMSAVMAREFGGVLERALADAGGRSTARERVVEGTVRAVELLVENPLFAQVLSVDPELLLPYVTDRLGATQRQAIGFIGSLLEQDDGSIRPLEPGVSAYWVQLVAQAFVLSARVTDAEGLAAGALDELRTLLDRYLRPQ